MPLQLDVSVGYRRAQMKAALRLVLRSLLAATAAGTVGCTVLGYPTGSIYTGTKVPHGAMRLEGSGTGKGGTARGEACATGILGLVAFGDASLAAAKKAGGIADVHSVEFGGLSILGIYTKGCTIAYGPGSGIGGGGGGGGDDGGGGDGGGAGGGGGNGKGTPPPPNKPSEPGTPGPGGPMAGGPGGGGGGASPKQPGGGSPGNGGPGVLPPVVGEPFTPIGFSFMYDEPVNHEGDHQCFTYDPSQPSDPTPFPSRKADWVHPENQAIHGHLVDHCPTENVVAKCDQRRSRQLVTFYYRGKSGGDLVFQQKQFCPTPLFRGVWTWVVQPDPVPKPPADHGTPAFACDRQKIENTCYSIRVGGDARAIDEQKAMCPMLQGKVVDHCPAEGVFGRCEDPSKGVTVFRYGAMFDLARKDCEKSGFSWTAP